MGQDLYGWVRTGTAEPLTAETILPPKRVEPKVNPIEQLERLLATWEKLGQGERNILLVFLMRLYAGQRKYGKLDTNKKDWTYEALEEALDMAVYMSCALQAKSEKAFNAAVSDAEKEVLSAKTAH
jgi:hypothetical protein